MPKEKLENSFRILVAALNEISEMLPCDEPCPSTYTACYQCNRQQPRWCAGCVARKALESAV